MKRRIGIAATIIIRCRVCECKVESAKSRSKHHKKGDKNTKGELSAKDLPNYLTTFFTSLANGFAGVITTFSTVIH